MGPWHNEKQHHHDKWKISLTAQENGICARLSLPKYKAEYVLVQPNPILFNGSYPCNRSKGSRQTTKTYNTSLITYALIPRLDGDGGVQVDGDGLAAELDVDDQGLSGDLVLGGARRGAGDGTRNGHGNGHGAV